MTSTAEWLESIGLGEYAKRFAENAIDLSILRHLTEQDLKELGVLLGHRRKMLLAIADLGDAIPTASTTPPTEPKPEPPDEAERRYLTIVFCDLVGSTALSTRLDPEEMWRVVASYQAAIGAVIGRHQGTIAQYMGDGVLAYFGYPVAHEDSAVQAVRAALEIVDAVAGLRTDGGTALQARIGIATGTVVVSELLITAISAEQAVVGETPNLAARLQALVEPGTVLICPSTRQLTGGYFNYRDVGPLSLKGFAQSISGSQVLGISGVESRFEAMHTSNLPPLIGREEEIELLLRRWRQVTQEEGRAVVLTGEPGIGKSHIALALDERLQNESHITLRYFCSAHHTHSALSPFINQLERAAGFRHTDSPREKLAKLDALLAQSTHDPEHVAVLADLLALPAGDHYRLQDLTPQKRREKTFAALLAHFDGLVGRQPSLVIFEDIQWIDPTSLELLDATVEHVPHLRALLLVTARPQFMPPWPNYPHLTTIALTRLGRRDTAALVLRVTGGKTLPKEVMDQILTQTDGVPLFIEELTKMVLEGGLLRERNGEYVLEGPLPPLAIPTTLQASLTARLDRLSPLREVAQIGSVAGREFHYELLNAVAGLPKQKLDDALDQLVRSELIFRRGEIPHAIYTFKHALVRDAAYAGLLKSRRVHLHAAIANVLEQEFPEVAHTQPETLAHHLTEAGLTENAIGHWLQAGKNAALRSANVEAIAHLERGIELSRCLPTGEGADRSELDLQMILGPCLIAAYGPAASKAMSTFTRARELCERLGQPPEYLQVIFWLATASVVRGELPQALEAIAGLPEAAEARGNRPALLNGIRGRAMILMFMGHVVEAREVLERAMELFNATPEVDRIAARAAGQDAGVSILSFMAWVSWILGQVDEGVSRMTAALERADVVNHAHTLAYAWYYASVLHALRGEAEPAQSYAERCLAISEAHGFRHWLGLSRSIRDICAVVLGSSENRLDEVKTAVDGYRSAGYQLGLTVQFVLLCPALLQHNLPEAALEAIDQGLSIVSRNSERFFEAELYRLKARALLTRGALSTEVESLLKQALRTARSQHTQSLELRAATDLARFWMTQGKCAEALDMLSPTYACFTEGFDTPDLKDARTLLAELRR